MFSMSKKRICLKSDENEEIKTNWKVLIITRESKKIYTYVLFALTTTTRYLGGTDSCSSALALEYPSN